MAVAHGVENLKVIATDVSAEAIEVARCNAQRHACRRIEFRMGALLEPYMNHSTRS